MNGLDERQSLPLNSLRGHPHHGRRIGGKGLSLGRPRSKRTQLTSCKKNEGLHKKWRLESVHAIGLMLQNK